MNKKRIFFVSLIALFCFFLASCGPMKAHNYCNVKFVYNGYDWQEFIVKEGEKLDTSLIKEPEDHDDYYEYKFVGWDKDINQPINQDTIFTAVFDKVDRYYTVRFISEGKALYSTNVKAGECATYKGETPTKPGHKFVGWNIDIDKPITKDTAFVALFEKYSDFYEIKFEVNYNTYKYKCPRGKKPIYEGLKPTKDVFDRNGYKFVGWDKEIEPAYENRTYTAMFERCPAYRVEFLDFDGYPICTTWVNEGEKVEFIGVLPRAATSTERIYFNGWDTSVNNIRKDTVIRPNGIKVRKGDPAPKDVYINGFGYTGIRIDQVVNVEFRDSVITSYKQKIDLGNSELSINMESNYSGDYITGAATINVGDAIMHSVYFDLSTNISHNVHNITFYDYFSQCDSKSQDSFEDAFKQAIELIIGKINSVTNQYNLPYLF